MQQHVLARAGLGVPLGRGQNGGPDVHPVERVCTDYPGCVASPRREEGGSPVHVVHEACVQVRGLRLHATEGGGLASPNEAGRASEGRDIVYASTALRILL